MTSIQSPEHTQELLDQLLEEKLKDPSNYSHILATVANYCQNFKENEDMQSVARMLKRIGKICERIGLQISLDDSDR